MTQKTIPAEALFQLHQLTRRVSFNRQLAEAAKSRIEINPDELAAIFDDIQESLVSICAAITTSDEPSQTSLPTASKLIADQAE